MGGGGALVAPVAQCVLDRPEGLVVGLRKPPNAAVFTDAHSASVLNLEISISRF